MNNNRVQIDSIVQNQLPDFVREEFPLVLEFLSEYYKSLENQGNVSDLIQNIDKYIKIDNITNLQESTVLSEDIGYFNTTINVVSTYGFPEKYGLILIDDEIITYKSKTNTSFNECIRGFSGITQYTNELVFEDTIAKTHNLNTTVKNLSVLMFKEFLNKIKLQITPGFENRDFYKDLNQKLFIKQSVDFYKSKGSDESFEILFRALYGNDVEVIKPRDYLIEPSSAEYRNLKFLVVEAINGDVRKLENRTLYQDNVYNIPKSQGTIVSVESYIKDRKEYFLIGLDYYFDTNIQSVHSDFTVHSNTKVVSDIEIGSSYIDVDSTVSFPEQGSLVISLKNGTSINVSYTSKNLNQFLGCSGISQKIEKGDFVRIDAFAYSYVEDETVTVRVSGVLSEIRNNILGSGYDKGDSIRIKTLGKKLENDRSNNWFFNIPIVYNVKSLVLKDSSSGPVYEINFYDDHNLKIGDESILISSTGQKFNLKVISYLNKKSIEVRTNNSLNLSLKYRVEKYLLKSNIVYSENDLSSFNTNVQNVYYSESDDSTYVASSSLPYYGNDVITANDKKVVFSGSFNSDYEIYSANHGLYTGDSVVYFPNESSTLNLNKGIYYIKKETNNTFKISRSRNDIFNQKYISLTGISSSDIFIISAQVNDFLERKYLQPQNLLRKIRNPIDSTNKVSTPVGPVGIFVNGVEAYNYKSNDVVYYGPILGVEVLSSSEDFDVINPPEILIQDSIGSNASVYSSVTGSLTRIDVVDGGFDYLDDPKVIITGGNGINAKASANLISVDHEVSFNSSLSSTVNLSNNTIGFTTYHKFRDNESVFYNPQGQTSVGGLSTSSIYYVSVQDAFTIKLHKSFNDSVSGINTIALTSLGVGNHKFKSSAPKKKISSISIIDSGSNYSSKKTSCTFSGINTSSNQITLKNHGYSDGELITYSNTGSPIGGLSTTSSYYVTKVDNDNIKLSSVGISSEEKNFFYKTKQFVNLTSSGSGDHIFNYEPISVTVEGNIGISTLSGQNFNAVLQPVFRGKVDSIFIKDGGSGYGSEDIINYNRQPEFSVVSPTSAQISPIVSNGSIVDVVINNFGSNYKSIPDLVVRGDGSGAKITPVLRNGQIVSVIIEKKGFGYNKNTTSIDIISRGTKLELNASIKTWRINDVERLISTQKIVDDDGVIVDSPNEKYQLQYSHKYSPRSLRKYVLSQKNINEETIYVPDLVTLNGVEQKSTSHSPIIGWAYDGNPIYGPYGYSVASGRGSSVKIITSGYTESIKENRPSISIYPSGFFVEDYSYTGSGDLDIHNGRFCVTPEFPKGVYAYFCTINDISVESSGIFKNFRKPTFPYIVGNTYKSLPIIFNYQSSSNQNDIDLNQYQFLRNIYPYNFGSSNSYYDYFNKSPNDINQISKIKSVSSGNVSSVGIVTGGFGYKVGDTIYYESYGFSKVSSITGKSVESISVVTSEVPNVELLLSAENSNSIVGYSTVPHGYNNNDLVSIAAPNIKETSNITVNTNILKLNVGVGSTSYTGIVTYFDVYGNLSIKENDVYQIFDEEVKVLNVYKNDSRIRVLRNHNNIVSGLTTFPVGSSLTEKSRKFSISSGIKTSQQYSLNKQLYFNPIESIGIGTTSGTGVGTTIVFSNPGSGTTQIFIPTKSIYIPNHDLETNTQLIYSSNGGNPISVSTDGVSTFTLEDNTIVYSAKISNDLIGISTVNIGLGTDGSFVGLGSTNSTKSTLYVTNIGFGDYHSFKTNYDNVLLGSLHKNTVTVSTAETHGLSLLDTVNISVVSSSSTTFNVKYNDYNRVMILNERSFTSTDVDINLNTINIEDHGYVLGEKILYRSTSLVGGLEDQSFYYAVPISKDKIRLASSYYASTKNFPDNIDLTSVGSGTFSQVNPHLNLVSNSTVIFDLSDPSLSFTNNSQNYSAFDFDFYYDSTFTNKFEFSDDYFDNEVLKTGIVGLSSDAQVILNITDKTPRVLFYKLTPANTSVSPNLQKQIVEDVEVIGNNGISVVDSAYSGSFEIVGLGSTTFEYNTIEIPESVSYTNTNSKIEYDTTSRTSSGSIKSLYNSFSNSIYYDEKSLPGISSVVTNSGSGSLLNLESDTIGNITSIEILDFGIDYHSDLTLNPTAKISDLLTVDAFYSIEKIGISSVGKNYTTAPDLLLKDSSGKIIDDVDLSYSLGDTQVNILRNTKGISGSLPTIIPINNSNGVKISNISYDDTSKNVTVTLGSNFSDIEDFPFAIGEKVLIENVSIGIGSTSKGYNSSSYNYSTFTIANVDANIGGIGATISYNISEYLSDGEYPGTYDPINSAGIVVPEKHFPIFDVSLKSNDFYIGETVVSENYVGYVEEWDNRRGKLKVSSSDEYVVGKEIKGLSSNTIAFVTDSRFNPDLTYEVSAFSVKSDGWKTIKGFLNEETQRVHDSDYYQYFSYSLKSDVSYDVWENPVSSLNHTAGFKKFSDLQVLSKSADFSGITTEQNFGDFTGISDISSVVDLNCVYDFDLAREGTVEIDEKTKSNQIIFNSKILQDYIESVGNRVLKIDNITNFNSNPRSTRFSVVASIDLNDTFNKYITLVKDRIFIDERQVLLVSLLQDRSNGFLNQYGKIDSFGDLGFFDFNISGTRGQLLFYPIKSSVNDYDVNIFSFNINNSISGVGSTNLGDSVYVGSSTSILPTSSTSPVTVVGIASTYRSSKVLVQIGATDRSYFQANEITILHDGINVDFEEYGELSTDNLSSLSSSGLGTYYAYYSGSDIKLDFIPNNTTSKTYNINTVQISLSDSPSSTGSYTFINSKIESNYVSISSSPTPGISTIFTYQPEYEGAYGVISIKDSTNQKLQTSEIVVLNDLNYAYISEFGVVNTGDSLGSIGATIYNGNVDIQFTPNENIDTEVTIYVNTIGPRNETYPTIDLDFQNFSMTSETGLYIGAESEIKRSFDLTHNQRPIFQRDFDGSDSNIIGIGSTSTIKIPENYFVTGEEVIYSYSGAGTTSAIGIATTSISGIGVTDKLPNKLYIVKEDDIFVKVAASSSDALSVPPNILQITNVGIGTSHTFTSKNQNSKVLLTIDNVIQSPIVSTSVTSLLAQDITRSSLRFDFTGITSFFGGDLIKIDDEIMRISSVGLGTNPNTVTVRRPWFGTGVSTHSKNSVITKVFGNYNIVDNTITFADAPYGRVPFGTTTNRPDERDYTGIETSSTFSGRVFLKSGVPNTDIEPYSSNYIFDSISSQFDGSTNEFVLKSNFNNISGISTSNAIILINDIFQGPSRPGSVSILGDYDLIESSGITSIRFTGSATSTNYDVNTASIPRGGMIVSVGSTSGLGYQPLVSAGGTAVVSIAGTIQSISIGNSGSGYRSGIQTVVNVGVATSSLGISNIEFIGTASVIGGNIVSVAITNPGSGYTSTNPPIVIFDSPLSYSNIPLIYSSSSTPGVGTGAVVDIIVGQGSSIFSFEITNLGYGYGSGEILTIDSTSITGIPTDSSVSFDEFQITVERVFEDEFTGWTIGDLQVFDVIDDLFDGKRVTFPLKSNGNQVTIKSKVGSNIVISQNLLIFLNDILQVPDSGYIFDGGSIITFTEAPKVGDSCKIIFYRGTGGIDTLDVDILETIKFGDTVRLNDDNLRFKEDSRTVYDVISTDVIETNVYSTPGISNDPNYTRPIIWCKQSEDKIINGQQVAKDRILYEPLINPSTNIIQNVSTSSTEIFVESVKTFFDSANEYIQNGLTEIPQKKIIIISQESVTAAAATAIVSTAGTISSIEILDGGVGYTTSPTVIIENPIGLGTEYRSTAVSTISVGGTVNSISITYAGLGYTSSNPPVVLIETPNIVREVIDRVSYDGDFGIISGVNTTSVGVASTALVFDLYIPENSYLRDNSINSVGIATTGISGIQTGYYFVVSNSNIGNGVTSLYSDNTVLGIGTEFLDNVYQVSSVSIGQTDVIGVGITYVAKVTVSISDYNGLTGLGYSGFYGNYSWGRIYGMSRTSPTQFTYYNTGILGITTSPVVQRYNPLKYEDYSS